MKLNIGKNNKNLNNMEQITQSNTMAWYAIRTQNNKEKWVSERIQFEFETNNLKDFIGEIIIPHEKTVSVRNGKKVFRDKMLYPGYVFVETSALGELKHILKGINGAGGLVRTQSGEIFPMRDSEVKRLLDKKEDPISSDKLLHNYIIGENVIIKDGPFSTFNGTIEDIHGEKVKVGVMIFGRKTPVDLTIGQIERSK
jgi:transcriptional antiterminator NusG